MTSPGQDIRLALRTLFRSPMVTMVAVFTLALGIGATTAIFSLIRGVLFDPLSASDPHEVMVINETTEASSELWISYENFRDYQARSKSFESIAVARPQSVAVTGGDQSSERIRGLFVSASFFDVLDERPELGRAILAGEDVPGGPRTAVLSHGFWQRRYGGDPNAVGKSIKLNNEIHTVVGVMPTGFRFPLDTTEAWISLQTFPGTLDRGNQTLFAMGRLADGVTPRAASEEMTVLARQLAEAHPEVNRGRGARAWPYTEMASGGGRSRLFGILLAAVVMVLLIACANVANLQLSRATGRHREMAVRTALGAGRARLVRQLLTENLILAAGAGALALVIARAGIDLLVRLDPGFLGGGLYDVEMNPLVLAFAALTTLTSGVIFGLAPALRASRTDLVEGLRENSRTASADAGSGRLRSGLVVAQTALAVILLIGAGLLLRSFAELRRVEVGFEKDNLLTVQFRLPGNKYESDEQVIAFFDQMLERVGAVPGVQGVVSALGLPFTGDEGYYPFLADGVDPGADVQVLRVGFNVVSPGYFEGMGIPLRGGRTFTAQDRQGNAPIAVVSQEVAEHFWPGEDAVGRTFRPRGDETLFTIVGVVGDVRSRGLRRDTSPMAYAPYTQTPSRFATIGVRVPSSPMSYAPAVRQAIWELDADQPLWEVMSQNERISFWTGRERFTTSLLGVFAAVALILAAVGIAGVIAYSIGQRTREIGIRLALGARGSQILRLVMRQGVVLLASGLAVGGVGAYFLSRALSGILFGVESFDLLSYTAAPAVLAAVALAACYVPARRATRLDPGTTLRDE